MTQQKRLYKLDLSSLDVRVKNVLRRLDIDTIEKLLTVTEQDMSPLKNCGHKTIAKIMKLQKKHDKEPDKQQMILDGSTITGWEYMNRLIVVAIAAKEVLEGSTGQNRHYCRVSRQRINALRRALEKLKKP